MQKLLEFMSSFLKEVKSLVPLKILAPTEKFIKQATISFRIFKKFELILQSIQIEKINEDSSENSSMY